MAVQRCGRGASLSRYGGRHVARGGRSIGSRGTRLRGHDRQSFRRGIVPRRMGLRIAFARSRSGRCRERSPRFAAYSSIEGILYLAMRAGRGRLITNQGTSYTRVLARYSVDELEAALSKSRLRALALAPRKWPLGLDGGKWIHGFAVRD